MDEVSSSLLTAERVREIMNLVSERRQAGHDSATQSLQRLRQQLARATSAANKHLDAVSAGSVPDDDDGNFKQKYQDALQQRAGLQRLVESEEKLVKNELRPISTMDAQIAVVKPRTRLIGAPKDLQKRY